MSEKFFQDNIYKKLKIDEDVAFGLNKESRLNVINYLENNLKTKFNCKIRIAELGCGTGYFSAYIMRRYKDVNVDLYDISSSVKVAVKKVMEISGINQKRYNFYSTDTNQNFKTNYYDIVFTCGALHHSYSLYKYFESIQKSLKPNGLLVSQEPAYSEKISAEKLSNLYKNRLNIKFSENKPIYKRYDFFFRLSEYLVTSRFAGLDLYHLKEWDLNMNHPEFYVGSKIFRYPIFRFLKFIVKIPLNFYRNKKYLILSRFKILPKNYLLIFNKPNLKTLKNWKPHLDILGIKEEK